MLDAILPEVTFQDGVVITGHGHPLAPSSFEHVGKKFSTVAQAVAFTMLIASGRSKEAKVVEQSEGLNPAVWEMVTSRAPTWGAMGEHTLQSVILKNFQSNPEAREWLLATDNKPLIWAEDDLTLGTGEYVPGMEFAGKNVFGRALELTRSNLRK